MTKIENFSTKVPASNLSQPDAYTCQSTCIAMITKEPVYQVRESLERAGDPGSPEVMGDYLKRRVGSCYSFLTMPVSMILRTG